MATIILRDVMQDIRAALPHSESAHVKIISDDERNRLIADAWRLASACLRRADELRETCERGRPGHHHRLEHRPRGGLQRQRDPIPVSQARRSCGAVSGGDGG
jgi:hypothetical protein